jgi:nucleotide-binding universal stress UspA family protein
VGCGCPGGILTVAVSHVLNVPISTVVIGWNASRSNMRAIHESRSLLQLANEVFIATIDDTLLSSDEATHTKKLADYLSAYDITTQHLDLEARPERVGSTLLRAAHDVNADLLVMGAFGHSPTFEYWFAGATRDMLATATAPVFVAH